MAHVVGAGVRIRCVREMYAKKYVALVVTMRVAFSCSETLCKSGSLPMLRAGIFLFFVAPYIVERRCLELSGVRMGDSLQVANSLATRERWCAEGSRPRFPWVC